MSAPTEVPQSSGSSSASSRTVAGSSSAPSVPIGRPVMIDAGAVARPPPRSRRSRTSTCGRVLGRPLRRARRRTPAGGRTRARRWCPSSSQTSRCERVCTPAPVIATWPTSAGASASMHAPETAAVRMPVRKPAPISARGRPVSVSQISTMPLMIGRPRSAFVVVDADPLQAELVAVADVLDVGGHRRSRTRPGAGRRTASAAAARGPRPARRARRRARSMPSRTVGRARSTSASDR